MSLELKNLVLMIVEDEKELNISLAKSLMPYFAKIIQAKDGEEGFKKFKKFKPHLIITDISMPIKNGLEMSKDIKAISKTTPIIILSSTLEKERLLEAININIDKYLVKPYSTKELLAAIKAVVNTKMENFSKIEISSKIKFDQVRKVLIKEGKSIDLTKKELSFISLLTRNIGGLVSHDEIKANVWVNKDVSDAAIRTFIKRLRDKVGPDFIKNIPGLGYKVEA